MKNIDIVKEKLVTLIDSTIDVSQGINDIKNEGVLSAIYNVGVSEHSSDHLLCLILDGVAWNYDIRYIDIKVNHTPSAREDKSNEAGNAIDVIDHTQVIPQKNYARLRASYIHSTDEESAVGDPNRHFPVNFTGVDEDNKSPVETISITGKNEEEPIHELVGRVIQGPNYTNGVRIFKVDNGNAYCRYENGTNDKTVSCISIDNIILISRANEDFELTRNNLKIGVMNTFSRVVGKQFSEVGGVNAKIYIIKSLMQTNSNLIYFSECGKEFNAPIYTNWD